MSNSTYFVQECPTCGRRLQVRVEYLGKQLVCQHCQGHFIATDPSATCLDTGAASNALLRRADELLDTLSGWHTCQFRSPFPR
jgi:hypothetical protein